jgi:hypothetical protein
VEIVIVKSATEPAINKAAEPNATVIGPTIVPVRMVPGGIIVVVVRYGLDTVCRWRRVSTGSVRAAGGGRSASSGSGRPRGRARGTFFGRGGVGRWWGASNGRRWARHRIVAECRNSLRRATSKLCSNHGGAQG